MDRKEINQIQEEHQRLLTNQIQLSSCHMSSVIWTTRLITKGLLYDNSYHPYLTHVMHPASLE